MGLNIMSMFMHNTISTAQVAFRANKVNKDLRDKMN